MVWMKSSCWLTKAKLYFGLNEAKRARCWRHEFQPFSLMVLSSCSVQLFFCFVIWCRLVFSWCGAEGGKGWPGGGLVVLGLNMVATACNIGVWMCNILV